MFYKVLSRHRSPSSTIPGPNITESSLGCSRPDMNDHRTWGKMCLGKIWGPRRGRKLSQRDRQRWQDNPFTVRLNKKRWRHRQSLTRRILISSLLIVRHSHGRVTARRCRTSRQWRRDLDNAWMPWWWMLSRHQKTLVIVVGRQTTKMPTAKLPHRGTWMRAGTFPWDPQLYMALLTPSWLWGRALEAT